VAVLLLSKAEDRGAAPHARDASFALLYLVAGPRYTQQASALRALGPAAQQAALALLAARARIEEARRGAAFSGKYAQQQARPGAGGVAARRGAGARSPPRGAEAARQSPRAAPFAPGPFDPVLEALDEGAPLAAPPLPAEPEPYQSLEEIREALRASVLGAMRVNDAGYKWAAVLALRKAAADGAALAARAEVERSAAGRPAPPGEARPWEHPIFQDKKGAALRLALAPQVHIWHKWLTFGTSGWLAVCF